MFHCHSIFSLSYFAVSSRGEVRPLFMTEPGPGGDKRKRRARRIPTSISEGGNYHPRSDLTLQERSPYPARGNEVYYKEESDIEIEPEADESVVASTEEVVEVRSTARMAKNGEESDVAALLRYMKESEDARRSELVEMMRHMRGGDADRQREEDERRQRNRREDNKVRESRELLQEKLKGLGVYKDGSELGAFLAKFERIMKESTIDEGSWAERLYPKLPERMCLRVEQEREEEVEYKEIKRVLLKAAGETAITYGNQLFEANSELFKGKTAGGIAEWLRRVIEGVFQGCRSIEECRLAIALALLRRVLPQGGKAFMETRKVSEWGELRDSLEDWMSGREKGNFFRPLGGGPSDNTRGYRAREGYVGRENVRSGYDKDRSSSVSGYLTCFSCGERGHRSTECKKEGKTGGSGYVYRPPTCYSCGKVGHKSTECTVRKGAASVKREASPKKMSVLWNTKSCSAGNVAVGLVNGVRTKVLIDSGAELGSVPRALVPKDVVLCNEVRVKGYGGSEKTGKSFMCEFVVGGYRKVVKTIIDESESPGVACIVPFTLVNEEEAAAYRCAVSECEAEERIEMNVLTRSMAREERELDRNETEDGVVDWWSVVIPEGVEDNVQRPSSQPESLNMPEGISRVEEGHGVDDAEGSPEADEPQAKGSTEKDELEEEGITSFEGISVESDVAEFCGLAKELGPVKEGKDREEFKEEVMNDESLKEWRELADRVERGFSWKKGMLVRTMYVTWEEHRDVIVLPKGYRDRVKILGHDRNGHLGAEKVARIIGRHFVWPSMAKDISEHCRSCALCQVKSKHRPKRAPAIERPVLAEPFESVAVDLVGPLPKGKGGCRYILTYVCLATKWPEAVALRSITAKSVMEGLWSIFSRTSIPERVLSDQGGQFCGKVMGQLSEWLGIDKVRTSPYHPQTNGAVERMHGTMKGILGKCISDGLDWVEQLSFVMYVLRQMPHADSGYSPFDLVYGFRVRTPLDALYHGLYEAEIDKLNVCDWVMRMAERLERVRDSAALRVSKSRESRMQYLNRGTKLREFKVGDLVLYRVPGMTCKLADSWEGPYKIVERKGAVNYKIGKIGKERHSKVVHVNCLKEYKERAAIRRLDVVMDDQSEENSVLSGICEGYNEEEIRELLSEYDDVFSEVPGNTDRVTMTINTGDSQPIRQSPYSVPLGIREKVREELMNLEQCGIIERCDSSWASPLVPVRKADGGIRLCVDYRKVNAVTEKEPYYIPGFDEMVEKVGTGKVLSKVDLAKGFHQVLVEEQDRDKTCFICPFGKFRFIRMPFGLTNAPSVFQRLMDGVLVGCEDFARVYIDDILVVSQDWKTHLGHLKLLFDTLRQAGLTCKKKKCSFGRARLEFLGHQIGGGQISVPAARVEAIRNHPLPKTRKQLRSFLGLVGFYRRFIRGYHRWSSVLTPHTSTAMSRVVSWTDPMLDAFRGLCDQLCVSVCLYVPCVSDVFVLESDASSTGVGAVLSVTRENGNVPVAFFSRQLRGAQSRYSAQELEGLGVYEAIRHFAYFLYGKKFTVVTDHKGLVNMMTGRQFNRRIHNWCLKLTEFDFVIQYREGSMNIVADELSRCFGVAVADGDATHLRSEGGDVGQEKPT